MTPILPIIMLGIALAMACMEIIKGYLLMVSINGKEMAMQVKPPKARGHVDLEETKLEPQKKKAAPTDKP